MLLFRNMGLLPVIFFLLEAKHVRFYTGCVKISIITLRCENWELEPPRQIYHFSACGVEWGGAHFFFRPLNTFHIFLISFHTVATLLSRFCYNTVKKAKRAETCGGRKIPSSTWDLCWWRIFPINLCGWRNFPSPTYFGPALRLAFVTVYVLYSQLASTTWLENLRGFQSKCYI
jgi:hypothetical protein